MPEDHAREIILQIMIALHDIIGDEEVEFPADSRVSTKAKTILYYPKY